MFLIEKRPKAFVTGGARYNESVRTSKVSSDIARAIVLIDNLFRARR